MTRDGIGRIYGGLLLGLFVAVVSAVPVVTALVRSDALRLEKRAPTPAPAWPKTAADWEAWPARFEAFYDDSFGLRAPLLRLNSSITTRLLGRSASDRVLKGRDGWLFFTGDHTLEFVRGERRLGEGALATWRAEIERRRDWLAARGIAYVFAVAPEKTSAWPEKLPRHVVRSSRPGLEQQLRRMAGEARLPVVDLATPLAEAKAGGVQTYYAHDTHWNLYGAAVAARALTQAVADGVGGAVAARPGPTVEIDATAAPTMRPFVGGDLATMGRIEASEATPVPTLVAAGCTATIEAETRASYAGVETRVRRSHCPGAPRRLAVFHDSFGEALMSPLGSVFGEATFFWAYPTFAQFQAAVLADKPDVVIELRVERKLLDLPDVGEPGIE